jgi:uridine phosphorylase
VAGVGGPAAAVAIEELVALGGCELISIGLAGGLGGGCLSGDVVVLDGALPRDGVSAAYGATDQPVVPDPALRDEVMACLEGARVGAETGRSWTTDSVYRETRAGIDEAIAAGAVAVEMEAAAVLAVSRALGARSAAIVVIADRIVDGRWLPPDDLARCRRAEAAVIDALLDR